MHVCVCAAVSSNRLAEVEYVILKEWFDFLVASQDIKVDLFGMSRLYIIFFTCWLGAVDCCVEKVSCCKEIAHQRLSHKIFGLGLGWSTMKKIVLSLCLIIVQNLVGVCHTVAVYMQEVPKKFGGCWGHALWMGTYLTL